ncbi:MotA/TolQ/ExbB proton channel family protein [Phascolarctobacterium succinatutens]|uniref:MotA/TolQ/ExbB proton channel family protein n=1 Tax=Phascolarctobacterium succinatutens TaxID=626940 RepID=UPI003A948AD4
MQAITDLIMYFHKGGLVMWPLLACSVTVIAIAIERFIYYKSVDSGAAFAARYCTAVHSGDFAVATELARKGSGQCAQMLADVAAIAGGKEEKSAFLESRAGIFMATLRDKLDYLGIIVTMSPLLGLLGTIVGMIGAFSIFNVEAGAPMAITGGIGEALIATATGLCVAILSLCAHSYFAHRMDNMITDMEQCFSALLEAETRRGRS